MVLQGLKSRIFDRLNKYVGRWVAEVPAILWSLRMTPNRSTGFTPFFLAYEAEAMLPSDLNHSAPRVKAFDHDRAAEDQQDAVDLLEEAREMTLIRSARYQQTLRKYHERKIRRRILEVGDLVLQRTQSTKKKHKLSPPWEGPYTVTEVIRLGTYRLEDDNGNVLTNTWNIEQLCRFPLKFGLTTFLVNTCSCKAPRPEQYQPKSLGGYMRI